MILKHNWSLLNPNHNRIDYRGISILVLSLLIVSQLSLKLYLLFRLSVNQDEFYYLSRIYEHLGGTLNPPLQAFHVHFFQWLTLIGPNEIPQLIGARMVMYLLFLGTCGLLFLIGRYFLDATSALFSVLCYTCLSFATINGASFRSDTIATFLFLLALFLFLTRKEVTAATVAAGLCMALALMFTIKSAIHMTVFGPLILILLFFRPLPKILKPVSGFLAAYLLGTLILQKLHLSTLNGVTMGNGAGFAAKAYSTFVSLSEFFPQFHYFRLTLDTDLTIWLLLFAGILFAVADSGMGRNVSINLYLFPLLLPLFSLFFFRNAFPYFYLFITPSAVLFCGYLHWRLARRAGIKHEVARLGLVVIFAGLVFKNFFPYYAAFSPNRVAAQYGTLEVIHKIFPEPVPYIDGCSMVASFPKAGFFMSSVGMTGYLKRGEPIMEELLREQEPLFLLANVPHLNLHSSSAPESDTGLALRADDWRVLRSNFVYHWGPVWLLGKRLEFKAEHESRQFEIRVAGIYTAEGSGKVLIDGNLIQAGDTINLEIGNHTITSMGDPAAMSLKWGDHPYKPAGSPPSEPLFFGPFL